LFRVAVIATVAERYRAQSVGFFNFAPLSASDLLRED